MPKVFLKCLTPIIYGGFLISSLWLIFFTPILDDLVNRLFNFNLIGRVGATLIWTVSAILILCIFWFANKILAEVEKIMRPTVVDHVRQSAVPYAIILASIIKMIFFNEYHFGLNNWLTHYFLLVTFITILINALYLFRLNKKL